VTLAIVLHKIPASISLTGILLHCSYPRKRILWMIAAFALATPIGAAISMVVLSRVPETALPIAVAVSAGTFLAIATADLLPQIHSVPHGRYGNLFALAAGIAVMLFTGHTGH